MAVLDLTGKSGSWLPDTSKDHVIIENYVAGFQCGINYGLDSYPNKEIYAGTPVIETSDGKYQVMPLDSGGTAYAALPEGATYVGVVKCTVATADCLVAVMDIGAVQTDALHIPYTSEMLTAMKSNLKIVFRK